MPRKWHDIIVVYGYEIYVPGDVDSTDYINQLMKLKTNEVFRVYTLVQTIDNGWNENRVTADDVFPIIGFEVNDVSECLELCHELDQHIQEHSIYESMSLVEKPKLFSGINVDSIKAVNLEYQ